MASPDLSEIKLRCCEVIEEAMTTELPNIPAAAIPYFIYQQSTYPYFTIRIAGDDIGYTGNEIDEDIYTFIIRCVIGHVTSGYEGQNDEILDDIIPVIKTAFNQNEGLISAAYPTAALWLEEGGENRMQSHSGFRVFNDSGLIGTTQVGTEFVLTCKFHQILDEY